MYETAWVIDEQDTEALSEAVATCLNDYGSIKIINDFRYLIVQGWIKPVA